MTSELFTALLLCGLWGSMPSPSDTPVPTAQELIAAAHRQTELAGIVPYVLNGTVVLNPGEKKERKGRLAIYRDRDRSRVDLVFGDYSETRITIGDRKYIPKGKELLNYTGISTLDEMWDPGQQPRYPTVPVYEFGKVKKSRVSGRPAWCFDKIWPHGKDRLCFDAASSLLISQNSSDSDHDEYLDYTATGEHWFPQLVKARKHALAALEVRDISISAGTIEDRLFAVPPDAIEVQACKKDSVPPKPISTPEPEFPASAGRETINVVLSAIVNKEGRLEEIAVLNPRADGLDANVMTVVSHWAFKPATCGGQPVNSEMSLEVEFKRF